MKKAINLTLLFLIIYIHPSTGQSDVFELKNQITTQATLNFADTLWFNLGGRYLPTVNLTGNLKKSRIIDMELSANGYGSLNFRGTSSEHQNIELKPYRMWIRYSSTRFELRAGLQKISFGSASILRPLMWFDKMDFRDPLQITDGVYGALGRYYFQNNVTIWLWTLYGNKDTKGWEVAPTQKSKAEYGGRFQMPVFTGEMALSYHYRKADFSSFYILIPTVSDPFFRQDMLGVDAKWDVGPGIWFEYTWKRNDETNTLFAKNEHYLNLGMDYTFSLGNGLNATTEFFRYEGIDVNNFSVLALTYPFGLMNRLITAVYYNWDNRDLYRLINIRRDYNLWSFNLIAYWNPESTTLYSAPGERNLMAGKGVQFMVTVNF